MQISDFCREHKSVLQDKLSKILEIFKERHIELNPPTSLEDVRQIEAHYHITLPQEYVSFITTIGNGGVLPDSSGLAQLSWYLYPIEQCSFEYAAIPFPYTEAWDWGHDDTYNSLTDPEGKVAATRYGHFAFTAPAEGEGYAWHLIVNGPCSGEVWEFTDWKMCRGKSVDFLDWILDCVERGFQAERYADPEDDKSRDLNVRLEKLLKKLKRKKLIPNPVVSEQQLFEIECSLGIKLPKEYAAFLSKIGNGFSPAGDISNKTVFPLEYNDFGRLSKPFPLKDTWCFVTDQCRRPQPDAAYNVSADKDQLWSSIQCGYITLAAEKKRNLPIESAFLLIINGTSAGEIWCLTYYTATGQGQFNRLGKMSFLDWLEDYIDGFDF